MMNDKWRFDYLWEKMQKRVATLEHELDSLKRWKKEQERKQYVENNKRCAN